MLMVLMVLMAFVLCDLLWKVLRPKSLVRVKPQRDCDPKTPLRGSRSTSRTRAKVSTVTAPTDAFATDKVATERGEAVGAEASAPVKPTDVILEPAEIAVENMNDTATSAEAGQLEASGGSAIPSCSADPAHVEAVAVAVPSIAASLLQEVAEVGKRPISAETVEQVVAGPEKIGDENVDESVTPTEAQHEAAGEVPGGSRLPSCEMATELAQILRIEELARLQGLEQEEPAVIQSSCNPSSSQQDVGHDAGGHSDSEVPEPPRAPPEEDDGTSPLKLSLKATAPVGRPLGFRRGMEKVSVKAPPRVAKPPLGKAKGAPAPAQPVPLAQPQTPPPPLPPPPPKGAVPKAQQKQVQIQVAEKAALPETSAADVSAATMSAATAPAPVAAKAQPKQVQIQVAEKAALTETPAATASAAPAAPVAAKAQPKQVQVQVAEKAALPETSAADVSAATMSAATAPAPVAAKAQPKQVQVQVAEKAALTETPAATVSAAPAAPVAAKAQPKQVQFQVADKAAVTETPAATVSAATAPGAPAPAAAKAQPRQVQFQVAEEAAPHPPTAACAQAPPTAPTAPASSLAPLVDSITRSSPSPAKAQAVHNIGAKAAARVILKGSDGHPEGRPGWCVMSHSWYVDLQKMSRCPLVQCRVWQPHQAQTIATSWFLWQEPSKRLQRTPQLGRPWHPHPQLGRGRGWMSFKST